MNPSTPTKLTLLAALSVAVSSCCVRPPPPQTITPRFTYVLVEFSATAQRGATTPSEVRETPTYRQAQSTIRSVAIRLPEHCATITAAVATGAAGTSDRSSGAPTDQILTTACGLWLSELERGLSRHYRVISWDALRRLETSTQTSTYQAAQRLGADVVFVINSLEANPSTLGASGSQSLSYFSSDEFGNRRGALALNSATRTFFRNHVMMRAPTVSPDSVVALSATLDTTAIITTSGESAWFFRRAVVQPVARRELGMQFLFMGSGRLWRPVLPQTTGGEAVTANTQEETLSATDTVTTVQAGQTGNQYAAERLALIRSVVEELVVRFRGQAG
jgi:hypothetical protein